MDGVGKTLLLWRRAVVTVGVAVVVLVVALLAWVLPEGRRVTSLDQEKQTLTTQEQALEDELIALEHDQRRQALNCRDYAQFESEIPPSLDESQFVLDVGSLARAAGDPSIPSLTWGASSEVDGLQAVQVTLTLEGTFGQVTSFVKGLDGSSFPRLFVVSSFSVGLAGQQGGSQLPASSSNGSSSGAVVVGPSLAPSSLPGYEVKISGDIYDDPAETDPCSGVAAGLPQQAAPGPSLAASGGS